MFSSNQSKVLFISVSSNILVKMSISRGNLVSAIHANDIRKFKKLFKSSNISRLPVLHGGYSLLKLALEHERIEISELLTKKNFVKVNKKLNHSLNTPLHDAVRLGQSKIVKHLVSMGANVNTPGRHNATPLHVAAKYGHFKIMEYLLENGANVRVICTGRNYNGYTPLHFACQGNHLKCVRLLLRHNADVKAINSGDIEPVHIAVSSLNIKIISLLLNYDANVNTRFRNEFYPLLGFNLHYRYADQNFTLLLCAISLQSTKVVKLLLDYGADVDMRAHNSMVTPLIEAIETNDPEMVELILDNGGTAFVNVYSFMDIAPLHHVIMSADTLASAYSEKESTFIAEKLKIIEILIAAGADINSKLFSRNYSNWSILEISIYFGYKQILHYILFHTDIDLTNLDYSTVELAKFNNHLLTDDIQDMEYINTCKNNYKQITYDIIFEILRRKELGLFSNEETLMRINFPPTHIDVSEDEHLDRMEKIKEEINGVVSEMKTEKISSSDITFWKILTVGNNDLVKFAFNENLRALCIENYEGKYYIYYHILKKRLDYAIGKSISLEKALELLDVLVKNQLTYDCRERIVNFLDDDELNSFVSLKDYI